MLTDHRLAAIAKQVDEAEQDQVTLSIEDVTYLLDVIYMQQEQLFEQEFPDALEDDSDEFDEFGECLRCNGQGCAYCAG